jgi:hypothetical protein
MSTVLTFISKAASQGSQSTSVQPRGTGNVGYRSGKNIKPLFDLGAIHTEVVIKSQKWKKTAKLQNKSRTSRVPTSKPTNSR